MIEEIGSIIDITDFKTDLKINSCNIKYIDNKNAVEHKCIAQQSTNSLFFIDHMDHDFLKGVASALIFSFENGKVYQFKEGINEMKDLKTTKNFLIGLDQFCRTRGLSVTTEQTYPLTMSFYTMIAQIAHNIFINGDECINCENIYDKFCKYIDPLHNEARELFLEEWNDVKAKAYYVNTSTMENWIYGDNRNPKDNTKIIKKCWYNDITYIRCFDLFQNIAINCIKKIWSQ